jgi:hypothetical protein
VPRAEQDDWVVFGDESRQWFVHCRKPSHRFRKLRRDLAGCGTWAARMFEELKRLGFVF